MAPVVTEAEVLVAEIAGVVTLDAEAEDASAA